MSHLERPPGGDGHIYARDVTIPPPGAQMGGGDIILVLVM
ncbi:hypothetical protein XM69_u0084 [Vibrio parahaemolyticus]|nr:hypothetical protein XM69_u0084 [Vibrio parahaemolyticus]OQK31412.1 hypothetical protein XM71_u0070 [Vibrio parahaemolyticus]